MSSLKPDIKNRRWFENNSREFDFAEDLAKAQASQWLFEKYKVVIGRPNWYQIRFF
jgi:hypothetical protein